MRPAVEAGDEADQTHCGRLLMSTQLEEVYG